MRGVKWNITLDIGTAIASFGLQVLITILISFAVDLHKDLPRRWCFVGFWRGVYGFVSFFLSF